MSNLLVVTGLFLGLGASGDSLQPPTGRYEGFMRCLGPGEVPVVLQVESPSPGRLHATLTGPPTRSKAGGIGVAEAEGWVDLEAGYFKLDGVGWINGRWRIGGVPDPNHPLTRWPDVNIMGRYRSDRDVLEGLVEHPACGTFVVARDGRQAKPSSQVIPMSGDDQRTVYLALLALYDEIETVHQARAHRIRRDPPQQRRGRNESIRCGRYFLYYDMAFMRKSRDNVAIFFYPGRGRDWPPYGFTVSLTPPDARVEWVDEVETSSYAPGPRYLYATRSRGRRILRSKVRAVSYLDASSHVPIVVKGQDCGSGLSYPWG